MVTVIEKRTGEDAEMIDHGSVRLELRVEGYDDPVWTADLTPALDERNGFRQADDDAADAFAGSVWAVCYRMFNDEFTRLKREIAEGARRFYGRRTDVANKVGECPRCGSPIYAVETGTPQFVPEVRRTCNCKELLDAKELGVTSDERKAGDDEGEKEVLHG